MAGVLSAKTECLTFEMSAIGRFNGIWRITASTYQCHKARVVIKTGLAMSCYHIVSS